MRVKNSLKLCFAIGLASLLCVPAFIENKSAEPAIASEHNFEPKEINIADYANNTIWNPFGWGTHGVSTAGITDTVAADNQGSLWGTNNMLDFSLRDSMTFEFRFNCYDNTEDNCGRWGEGLDFYICNEDCTKEIGVFRIWSKAWGAHNGSHNCRYYDLTTGGWTSFTETFTDEYGDTNSIILGDAASNSSFVLRFSKTKGIEFKNTWNNFSYIADKTMIDNLTDALADLSGVGIKIGADGGFARQTIITICSYEGQWFGRNNESDSVVDNTYPAYKTLYPRESNTYVYDDVDTPTLSSVVDIFWGDCTTELYYDEVEIYGVHTYQPQEVGDHGFKIKVYDARGNCGDVDYKLNVLPYDASKLNEYLLDADVLSQECHEHYENAKKRVLTMSQEEKNLFKNNGDYISARMRYESWCRANGDNNYYDGDIKLTSSFSAGIFSDITNSDSPIAICIFAAISAVTVVSYFLLTNKKKEN